MKRLIGTLTACAVILGATTGAAMADTTLRMSSWIPASHFLNANAIIPWSQEVSKVTNGRVKINLAPKTIGSSLGQFDVVRDGLADIAVAVPGYTPGRFDLAGIVEMPLLTEDTVVSSVAFQRLYDKYLKEVGLFNEVQVLSVFTGGGGHFFMRDKAIKSVADVKGMKIRAAVASTIPTLSALGSVPVQKPSSEMYELMTSGVLDGSISGLDQVLPFNLAGVVKRVTVVPGALFNSAMILVVNKDAWAKISKADQEAIEKISGEALSIKVGQSFVEPIQKGEQAIRAAGGTVERAGPEMMAEMNKILGSNDKTVLDMARKNGIRNPEEMMTWYRGEIKRLSTK